VPESVPASGTPKSTPASGTPESTAEEQLGGSGREHDCIIVPPASSETQAKDRHTSTFVVPVLIPVGELAQFVGPLKAIEGVLEAPVAERHAPRFEERARLDLMAGGALVGFRGFGRLLRLLRLLS